MLLRKGEAVAIIATSEEVTPFLAVYEGLAGVGASQGVKGENGACVSLGAPRDITLRVLVSSADPQRVEQGQYRLRVLPYDDKVGTEHRCNPGGVDGRAAPPR